MLECMHPASYEYSTFFQNFLVLCKTYPNFVWKISFGMHKMSYIHAFRELKFSKIRNVRIGKKAKVMKAQKCTKRKI